MADTELDTTISAVENIGNPLEMRRIIAYLAGTVREQQAIIDVLLVDNERLRAGEAAARIVFQARGLTGKES